MTDAKNYLLPALIAAGTGLAPMSAAALQLADIKVQSALGQPLRASIAYALNPNELLRGDCVSVQPAPGHAGAPAVNGARASAANGVISVSGSAPVNEPIVSLRIDIDCPYTPRLARVFTMLVDPAQAGAPAGAQAAAAGASRSSSQAPGRATAADPGPAMDAGFAPERQPRFAANAGDGYLVQPGDTLSSIAARVRPAGVSLWAAATRIHAFNPDAFIDNDPNLLKAGARLAIPPLAGEARVAVRTTIAARAPQPAPEAGKASPASAPAAEPRLQQPAAKAAGVSPAAAIAPGGIHPLPQRTEETMPAPADTLPEPTAAQPAAAAPEATALPGTLWWLIGAGAAMLAGLLALMRRKPRPASPAPAEAEQSHPLRRATDAAPFETIVADDYALTDDCPTSENLALDADLEHGSGLGGDTGIAVSENFGFSTVAELDFELPAEEGPGKENVHPTDVIAAPMRDTGSILESEILPETDDYAMSVVMDVTKMPDTEAVTERDLKAVVVADDDTGIHDTYTISQDVDYEILEQDYEEALSATQALNLEIERAAAELAERLDEEIAQEHANNAQASEETAALPLASVTRLERARQREQDEVATDGDELSGDDLTAELPASRDRGTG